MNKLLFISTNNGSDMRINKEIKTLSKHTDIYFLGVGKYGNSNYAEKNCKEFILIQEKRNSINAILKQIKTFLKLNRKHKFTSIHIINEQLMIFFYPWLFQQYVVLDIFDSFFMKKNKPKNQWKLIKKMVYAPINYIFVTDKNRESLMPDFVQNKLGILENYPNRYHGDVVKKVDKLTIFYNGSMNNSRGTILLQNLTDKYKDVKVIMAGWLSDENTKNFAQSKSVDFKGVLTQLEASKIAANQAHYIMCCYEPSNQNNINASPNKIYDAIQTHTPVIINSEVKVSSFVKEENLGVILSSFSNYNVDEVYQELLFKKDSFSFNKKNAEKYSWESIENKLLKAHKLIQ
ncbi:hypothetical protein UMM65_03005 [Aureibaculum sp. 2210JD6-5]|uniref:hypothetical protein n=1 Tax=Aureibaculum sp. 2210JD6-5 TaxID=3103957 RepID=UPI002AAD0389|nr:hypothetical protein [Aureibaculum sp. 2210JD6-5]MDY7394196.1 hypothetical protein [Aureibaculum sp. 2210JD6-5]